MFLFSGTVLRRQLLVVGLGIGSQLLGLGCHPAYAQRVAAGLNLTVTVRPNGTLWAWGRNILGEVGDGTTVPQPLPVQLGTATNWRSVTSSDYHSLALRQDGTLWAWGDNGNGQLGTGSSASQPVPVQVGTATTWRSVATGQSHTVAVRTDGTLWAWGRNEKGEVGDGTTTPRLAPVQIGTDTTWRTVTAHNLQTLALRRDGTLWAWGENFYGQLGLGVLAQATPQLTPTQLGTATWQSVTTCYHQSAAVRTDGTLWTWGQNYDGQLGDGTTYNASVPHQIGLATTWRTVVAGPDRMLAVRTDGSLWGWGQNSSGQLGDSTTLARLVPTRIGSAATWREVAAGSGHTAGVQADNSLWAWGYGGSGGVGSPLLVPGTHTSTPTQLSTPSTWQSLALGADYTIGLRPDGTLWAWGRDLSGQLGNQALATLQYTQYTPAPVGSATTWQQVAAGNAHTVAVRRNGTLWAWGNNTYGQLGLGTAIVNNQFSPVQVDTSTAWRSVVAGFGHTVAVRRDGTLWAWGLNGNGQLGDGTTITRKKPVQIGTATTWQRVAVGPNCTLAIRTDGTLWSWGENQYGQTGNGTNALFPVQVGSATTWWQVAAGKRHTLALHQDGTLWAWGDNSDGQLGLGTILNSYGPVQVGTDHWQSIAAGEAHSLAIRTDGTAWGWGLNSQGRLGDNVVTRRLTPTRIGTATTWQAVATALYHTALLRTDNTVWLCGASAAGQLGFPFLGLMPLLVLSENALLTVRPPAAAQRLYPLPNPAHDQVQLPELGATTLLQLFDLQGRLLQTTTGNSLLLRGLPSGLYLLQATEAGQTTRSVRLQVE